MVATIKFKNLHPSLKIITLLKPGHVDFLAFPTNFPKGTQLDLAEAPEFTFSHLIAEYAFYFPHKISYL